MRQAGKNRWLHSGIRLVKFARCQIVFCQESLTKSLISLDNKVVSSLFSMAKFGTLAAGALAATVTLGAAEQADAQATELVLPHPDGEITLDVSRVALETQAEILGHLQACLEDGFAFADADENGTIEGDEQWDWDDERGHCADLAANEVEQAVLTDRIEVAEARSDEALARSEDARTRLAAANAEIEAITQGLIDGARAETGL